MSEMQRELRDLFNNRIRISQPDQAVSEVFITQQGAINIFVKRRTVSDSNRVDAVFRSKQFPNKTYRLTHVPGENANETVVHLFGRLDEAFAELDAASVSSDALILEISGQRVPTRIAGDRPHYNEPRHLPKFSMTAKYAKNDSGYQISWSKAESRVVVSDIAYPTHGVYAFSVNSDESVEQLSLVSRKTSKKHLLTREENGGFLLSRELLGGMALESHDFPNIYDLVANVQGLEKPVYFASPDVIDFHRAYHVKTVNLDVQGNKFKAKAYATLSGKVALKINAADEGKKDA